MDNQKVELSNEIKRCAQYRLKVEDFKSKLDDLLIKSIQMKNNI